MGFVCPFVPSRARGDVPTRLGEEARGARQRADEPAHHAFHGGGQLRVEVRGERQPDALVPTERPEPLEEAHRRSREIEGIGAPAAVRAQEPARQDVEPRTRERIQAAAVDAAVDAWPMPEEIHGAEAEATRHPLRPRPALQRAEAPQHEAEEGRLRIAIGGKAGEALHHPRTLSQPLQVLAHAHEGMHDVEVVHPHELAAARVEEDELAQGEELQRAAKARARAPRRLGHTAHPTVVPRVEVDEAIALSEGAPPDDDALRLVESHGQGTRRGASPPFRNRAPEFGCAGKARAGSGTPGAWRSVRSVMPGGQEVRWKPNSRRARSSVRHLWRTPTASSRNTLMPKKRSRSSRAAVPICLRVAPLLPMRMPFCESCSTKMRARMYKHSGRLRSVSSSTRTAQA